MTKIYAFACLHEGLHGKIIRLLETGFYVDLMLIPLLLSFLLSLFSSYSHVMFFYFLWNVKQQKFVFLQNFQEQRVGASG